jgi:hypothetical protein
MLFIPDFTVGITIALLQTVPSLAVFTTASWLSVFDSTAGCCLRPLTRLQNSKLENSRLKD